MKVAVPSSAKAVDGRMVVSSAVVSTVVSSTVVSTVVSSPAVVSMDVT